MDRIELRGLRVLMHIGVPAAERAQRQPIDVDLDLFLDLGPSSHSDSVLDTADYGVVSTSVVTALEAAPMALLERAARVAADAALRADDHVTAVTATIRKVRPPVPVDLATAAVSIHVAR